MLTMLRRDVRARIKGDIRRFIVGLGIAAIVSFVLQFLVMMSPHLLLTYRTISRSRSTCSQLSAL
jgi:hypothetical protein